MAVVRSTLALWLAVPLLAGCTDAPGADVCNATLASVPECPRVAAATPSDPGIPDRVGVALTVDGSPASLGGQYTGTWLDVATDADATYTGGCAEDNCATASTVIRIDVDGVADPVELKVSIPAGALTSVPVGTVVTVSEVAYTGPGSLPEEALLVTDADGVLLRVGALKTSDSLDDFIIEIGPLALRAGPEVCRPQRDMCLRQFSSRALAVETATGCSTVSPGETADITAADVTYTVHNARIYERRPDLEGDGACADKSNGEMAYWVVRQ